MIYFEALYILIFHHIVVNFTIFSEFGVTNSSQTVVVLIFSFFEPHAEDQRCTTGFLLSDHWNVFWDIAIYPSTSELKLSPPYVSSIDLRLVHSNFRILMFSANICLRNIFLNKNHIKASSTLEYLIGFMDDFAGNCMYMLCNHSHAMQITFYDSYVKTAFGDF